MGRSEGKARWTFTLFLDFMCDTVLQLMYCSTTKRLGSTQYLGPLADMVQPIARGIDEAYHLCTIGICARGRRRSVLQRLPSTHYNYVRLAVAFVRRNRPARAGNVRVSRGTLGKSNEADVQVEQRPESKASPANPR
jgi:hypothetical protein